MREERGQEKEKERKEGKVVIKVKKGTSKRTFESCSGNFVG